MLQYRVNFEASSFDELTSYALTLMEAVVLMNIRWLKEHPEAPRSLVGSGIKYDPPPLSFRTDTHRICHASVLLQLGHGKCDSLTAYDVAARRLSGQNAQVAAKDEGKGLFHIVTKVIEGGHPRYYDVSNKLPRFEGPNNCRILINNGSDCDC